MKPMVTRSQMYSASHMTIAEAAVHFGVPRRYLENRSGQCCMKFKGQGMDIPPVLARRCACGSIFDCRDVLHERTCPACLERLAA